MRTKERTNGQHVTATKRKLWLWPTATYLIIVYSLGVFAVMVGGGGHGNLVPFGLYLILTLPAALYPKVLSMIGGHYDQSSEIFYYIQTASDNFLYVAPIVNAGLLWLVAWGLRVIRRASGLK